MKTPTILVNALGIALATGACDRTSEASNKTAAAEAHASSPVRVDEIRASSEGEATEIPASIESTRRAVLTARLSATIVDFKPREGDAVREGALLAHLEDVSLRAALAAAVASDRAAERDLNRAEALLARGAATRAEVDNASTTAERARSAVGAAREAASFASVRAPFAGRIVRKLAGVGDIVTPGHPLVEIEGTGGLEVVASVEGGVQERLKVGQRVQVRVDGVTNLLSATIHDLAPSADPSTHRFTLRADIAPTRGVRAGLFARLLMSSREGEARLLVPSGATHRRGGLTGVYVVRDGRAWLRWIAPGETFGDFIEVRAGLALGERVALEPSRLQDGALVSEDRR